MNLKDLISKKSKMDRVACQIKALKSVIIILYLLNILPLLVFTPQLK